MLIAVLGIFAGISIISVVALPVTQDAAGHFTTQLGTTYKEDPVLGIVSALPIGDTLQTAFRYYVGVLAATILVIATNAGLIGISRLSWSLAEHRQLPKLFARVHNRYRTPWFTIVFFSALACVLLVPGETDFLGNLYSFGAMLSFTTAHVAVIALRLKEPHRDRPYRVPWNVPFRGRSLPLAAVLGGLGTFAAWISVVVLHTEARTVGVAWMVAGMGGYFLYRRRIGCDPWEVCRLPRREAPQGFKELAYRSALVPIFGTDVNGRAMQTAARLAGDNAAVDAIYVIDVPPQLPLDSWMEQEEDLGRTALEVARMRARQRRLKIRTSIIRTRNPGAAIVEEAKRRGSEIIYLDTAHAPPTERALGPTATYLLGHRPCRVIVETGTSDGAVGPIARRQ